MLTAGGALSLNQLLEREADAKMKRTEDRPLASGRISPKAVSILGILLSVAGVGSLILSAIMAFAVVEVYVRITKPYETPDTWRQDSLEYETTLFARHAFPKMEQYMRERKGTGSAKINNKGYRGRNFELQLEAYLHI